MDQEGVSTATSNVFARTVAGSTYANMAKTNTAARIADCTVIVSMTGKRAIVGTVVDHLSAITAREDAPVRTAKDSTIASII